MRRRRLLSASLGLGAMTGLAGLAGLAGHAGQEVLAEQILHTGSDLAFGTTVTITVLHIDTLTAQAAIHEALQQVRRIDALMSLQQERSQVFQLNRRGILAGPDAHLLNVLSFAYQLSLLTAGAFDVTVQPLWEAFSLASAMGALPSSTEIAAAKALVNWKGLEFDAEQVRLMRPGMSITLNGVAQGYAVDLALQWTMQHFLVQTSCTTIFSTRPGEIRPLNLQASRWLRPPGFWPTVCPRHSWLWEPRRRWHLQTKYTMWMPC